jgi:hypothetical protein
MVRPKSRRKEIRDLLRVVIPVVQAATGKLSQPMAAWALTVAFPIK